MNTSDYQVPSGKQTFRMSTRCLEIPCAGGDNLGIRGPARRGHAQPRQPGHAARWLTDPGAVWASGHQPLSPSLGPPSPHGPPGPAALPARSSALPQPRFPPPPPTHGNAPPAASAALTAHAPPAASWDL